VTEAQSSRTELTPSDAFWWDVLSDQGVPEAELERAHQMGALELVALERSILLSAPDFDVLQAADLSGMDEALIRRFWRALGFPDPRPGEQVFTRSDIDMLHTVAGFIGDGTLQEDLALQMARVIGSSLARVAVAQVEASVLRREAVDSAPVDDEEAEAREVERSAQLVPMLATVLDSVWRRHLVVAIGRRVSRDDDGERPPITVGFADLVGFTALSQQLPEDELVQVIDRFETIAYDVVAGFGGRVVKMIGDEVMFMADDTKHGAEIALTLAERYAADDALSDVRVGLACGQALELEGDLYGPAVNLASRIVNLAYPGSVVVSQDVADVVGDDPAFRVRALRPHHLKHIGRVKLYALRRVRTDADEVDDHTLDRARRRRAARRQWIAERMAERDEGDERDERDEGDEPEARED
jgi:adenylate cyclase